uniref:Si:ch211-13f8.1 n=1 Tax=Poecilia formosa TaxID=48698 RepID=A0A096M6W8_POEFO
SASHALQTKVKSLTQRRTRGREREKDREKLDAGEMRTSGSPGQNSRAAKDLSSSDEDEEVEVQVRLEIHSPPVDLQTEQGTEESDEKSEQNEGQVSCCGLEEGTSLESLLSDNSSSSKDDPLPRHWAPPKGFWRVARPETLLLNGVGPHDITPTLPLKDYTQMEAVEAEPQCKSKPSEAVGRNEAQSVAEDTEAASVFKHSDSVEFYLDRCEQSEADVADSAKGLCSSDSWESTSSQSGVLRADLKLRVKERAYAKLRERQQNCREARDRRGVNCLQEKKTTFLNKNMWVSPLCLPSSCYSHSKSLLVISDELPLSPRHEQAKRLLERARLKARSSLLKDDRPRRSQSDQRSAVKDQQVEPPNHTTAQKTVQTKEDPPSQASSGPLLVPTQRDSSPVKQADRPRRYGCSPTRVRFEDESEKEAESRYLDRVRQRGRPGMPKSRAKESNTDSSSSGSEKSRGHRSISLPPSQKQEDLVTNDETTVIKEIIVLVKKCEACGSVVREPQPVSSPSELQNSEPQQTASPEDPRGKSTPVWAPSNKPDASTRPKAPLTVTFAGAYVLGENKESSTGWKSSGFGKLRRRSRKGENRLESGHGPYGPSWAQRRNSNPRNRVNLSRAVSFAPGSPVALEPHLLEASGGLREASAPSLPIKSALKSSSRNRSSAGQSTVQFQVSPIQGGESGSQSPDSPEARRESPVSTNQGSPAASSPVPCIRPSTLRYSPARIPTDLPSAEIWDATSKDCVNTSTILPSIGGTSYTAGHMHLPQCRDSMLKISSSYRKFDGRPKLFLRRFFSSIGLNSVGRLVKGGRSSSMEQLSLPTVQRASSASPSPTRRPQPTIRIQRTPSLQTLHTVLPLAQLRKASSVQSLERRTERSTILGEVQIPYGLAPRYIEIHRGLSDEDVVVARMGHPMGRVTQAFPDGTILLELIKPPSGPFGFVISRGKGRPDTGVYVEKVGDGGVEGLLGVGDEILQVNGEAVAGLSLDQVTRLMTRESTANLRILPARCNQR